MGDSGHAGLAMGFLGAYCCFIFFIYAYTAFCLMKIANKLGIENAWLSWIPIANLWIMVQAARKEWWWMILCFIPLVNIVAFCVLWMGIAENRGKPSWIGLLILIPVVNFIMVGYLAFTD